MAKHPELSLQIDIEKELENAFGFFDRREDRWFRERFFIGDARNLLENGLSGEDWRAEARNFVERYYSEHEADIRGGLELARTNWKNVESGYFELIDTLFSGRPWPKGVYTGVASVFGMFPRWVERKVLFFPYTHRKPGFANYVIGHELLHFMFFDYIFERYGFKERARVEGKEDDYIWKVSEAFNVVIEHWKPYTDVLGIVDSSPYPGQEEMFAEMTRQWAERQDAEWLLDQWLG